MNKIKVENRGIDERLFHLLCTEFKKIPAHNTLGMNLIYLGQGAAGIKMSVGHEYTSVNGRVHGGIVASLLDTVQGWAVISLRQFPMTIDNYFNYLAPAFEESELIAEAYVIKTGKLFSVVEASVSNSEGKVLLKGRGNWMIDNKSPLNSLINGE